MLDDNADPITDEQRSVVLKAVCDHLADDEGIVPADACHVLNVPAGINYGAAVAFLRRGENVV